MLSPVVIDGSDWIAVINFAGSPDIVLPLLRTLFVIDEDIWIGFSGYTDTSIDCIYCICKDACFLIICINGICIMLLIMDYVRIRLSKH